MGRFYSITVFVCVLAAYGCAATGETVERKQDFTRQIAEMNFRCSRQAWVNKCPK